MGSANRRLAGMNAQLETTNDRLESTSRASADLARESAIVNQFTELTVFPSQANFLLVKVPDAVALRDKLLRAGLLVRDGASVGFPGHLRISVGLRETNEKLLGVL